MGTPRGELGPDLLTQAACLIEATARKPGNVHPGAGFEADSILDYLISAVAIGPAFAAIGPGGVGRCVLDAVRATHAAVNKNTNLGMILLLAPMAAAHAGRAGAFRDRLRAVLRSLTAADACLAYEAIALAAPGGLGAAPEQDVRAGEPTVTLLEAMRLAADRDLVARQYATDYDDVFGVGYPALAGWLRDGRSLEVAIVGCYLRMLANRPDTLIARKRGAAVAAEASRRAAAVLAAGWPDARPDPADDLDRWLRADGHARNPGATADLTAAAIFLALAESTIPLPGADLRSGICLPDDACQAPPLGSHW